MSNNYYKVHCFEHYRYACETCHKPPERATTDLVDDWEERTALDALFDALKVVFSERQRAVEALTDFVEMRSDRKKRYGEDR